MNRKKFLRKGIAGVGSLVAIPTLLSSCKPGEVDPNACVDTPRATAGPFPIKTPAQLVRENIIGDRTGIPFLIQLTIQDTRNDCQPMENVLVDIWHCDAQGNYSEYDGQLDGDFTNKNFLRGRQTTDANGTASFISIFPGWYPGRTPHIHVEIKDSEEDSLLVTQVAWPEAVSNEVYAVSGYNGEADTTNANDGFVSDAHLADSLTGNATDGYVLLKNIKV